MSLLVGREMDMLKAYMNFQKAVFEGTQEAARLDRLEAQKAIEADRRARGYCPKHGTEKVSNGIFDSPCPRCEAEMED